MIWSKESVYYKDIIIFTTSTLLLSETAAWDSLACNEEASIRANGWSLVQPLLHSQFPCSWSSKEFHFDEMNQTSWQSVTMTLPLLNNSNHLKSTNPLNNWLFCNAPFGLALAIWIRATTGWIMTTNPNHLKRGIRLVRLPHPPKAKRTHQLSLILACEILAIITQFIQWVQTTKNGSK